MNLDEQLGTVCEEARFKRTVSKGMYYRTGEDVNDSIASRRECTLSRTHRNSGVKLWIQTYTEIGPVRDVKIICHHGRHGIEIQIPSTSGDNTIVWVVTFGGPNRYVDELRYRDPKNSPEQADHECMQDADQEQPTVQLEMSDDHNQFLERKQKDIIANEFRISKFVSKLVRHENCRERETDGVIHWKLALPKLIIMFRRDGSHEFIDRDWINCIWNGSNKNRFQHCQNSRNKLLYSRAISGHTGGEMIEREMGHVLIPISWKQFVLHRGCSFVQI